MLSILLLAMAQTATPQPAADEIVVIGRQAEKDLAACIARACPPKEEVEASLQASVEQFADGRYDAARVTLQRAIGRNKKHAAELPGPVSSLYATLSTVAEHDGDTRLWRSAARENVEILRKHVGETNSGTLAEEISFADSLVGTGAPQLASATYGVIERKAAQSGQSQLAAGAAFRRAWLALIQGESRKAERLADDAVARAGTDNRLMRELRDILQARIAIRRGDENAIDALAERLRRAEGEKPRLLFAPPIDDVSPARLARGEVETDPWHGERFRFADVGYWIRPNGRTANVEVLRNSGLGQWSPGILQHVGARRYTPFDSEPGEPGVYRIDRFTVRAPVGMATGSRLPTRIGPPSVHVVDLTETDAMREAARKLTLAATAVNSR